MNRSIYIWSLIALLSIFDVVAFAQGRSKTPKVKEIEVRMLNLMGSASALNPIIKDFL